MDFKEPDPIIFDDDNRLQPNTELTKIKSGSIASQSSVSNLQFEKDLKKYQINYHNNNNFYRGFEDMQSNEV